MTTYSPSKILIVDNQIYTQLTLAAQLKRLGYEYRVETDGDEAVSALENEEFQLVLINCYEQEMNGFEIACNLRMLEATQGFQRTPMIGIAADNNQTMRNLKRLAKMDGLLTLPIRLENLRTVIAYGKCLTNAAIPYVRMKSANTNVNTVAC